MTIPFPKVRSFADGILARSAFDSVRDCSSPRRDFEFRISNLGPGDRRMTLAAGKRLGPYEVLSAVGAGGMGEVYRARDSRLERDVAVKVLPAGLVADAEALARFEREAKAVAALSHPNIMAIHDFGREGEVVYAVMELLVGETLRERLAGGPIPQRKALDYALQIAQGLAAAHDRGIIHRDLKPENLFVTRDGIVKILDFGLASRQPLDAAGREQTAAKQSPMGGEDSRVATVADVTRQGMILGTVGYMSPEQVRGAAADHRSDILLSSSIPGSPREDRPGLRIRDSRGAAIRAPFTR